MSFNLIPHIPSFSFKFNTIWFIFFLFSLLFTPQVCVHNGHIHHTFCQLLAACRLDSLLSAQESRAEKRTALPHRHLHHQPQLLPGTTWGQPHSLTVLCRTWRDGRRRRSLLFLVWLFLCPGVSLHHTSCSSSTVSWDNLRIPGVLQRLAWSYLVVASLDVMVAKRHLDILTAVSQKLTFTISLSNQVI